MRYFVIALFVLFLNGCFGFGFKTAIVPPESSGPRCPIPESACPEQLPSGDMQLELLLDEIELIHKQCYLAWDIAIKTLHGCNE